MLSVVAFVVVRHGLYRELDQSLEQSAALLANEVELENGSVTYEWQEGIGTNNELTNAGLFQYWDESSGASIRSPMLGAAELPKFHGKNGTPEIRDIVLRDGRRARAIGMRIHPYVLPAERERLRLLGASIDPLSQPQVLVVARETRRITGVLTRVAWVLTAGMTLALMLGFYLIDRVVRGSLRPISELASQVNARSGEQTSALDLSATLPEELTSLTRDINHLLARVSATREREQDFIRHAAHELRTPTAELRATAELALSRPRDAAAYLDYLEICSKSAVRLSELVQRLSALARCGQPGLAATLAPVDLTELLDECRLAFAPAFARRGMRLSMPLGACAALANADRTLTRVVVTNLLDNAASYAPEGSEVHVGCAVVAGRVQLAISNQLEDLTLDVERLFEPLFRHDPSRHDAASHLGIGLTLSRNAASSMGATLEARLLEPDRIEFILSLAQ
jgi:two-component system sensor histidine kinase QseC